MRINGVRSKVRLCVSDKTNVELSLNGYNLNIKLFEDGNIRSLMVKDTLTTHIGHEMSHIVNGDVEYYTLGRAIVEGQREYYKNRSDYPLSYRIVIALVVLYECRADLFGRKSAGLLGRKYSSDWILGDNTYKKTGYLPRLDRSVILEHFKEYDYNLVDYIFNFYFEKDGFITRKKVNDYIQKSTNKKFKNWATSLMNGHSA